MRLIGLNGRMHSGKDSIYELIADYAIADDTSYSVDRIAFADKLKMSAAMALGISVESVDDAVDWCNYAKEKLSIIIVTKDDYAAMDQGEPVEHHVISGREYLQYYGTEAHRQVFGENFWVDALLPHNLDRDTMADVVVVTDVRFANEAERILELDGEVWWIDAEERLGPLPEDAHASERPLPKHLITKTIDNNGTLNDLVHNVKNAYYWTPVDLKAFYNAV